MTTLENRELRGITAKIIAWVGIGTFSICGTFIGGVWHIEKTMTQHQDKLENHDVSITKIEGRVSELEHWRNTVTAYYLPKITEK